jgi:TRAP-type C4-dicarboxylate transport system substrate-binding protein
VLRLTPAILAALLLGPSIAAADPIQLRMAAIAPEGTEWARELKGFAAGVQSATADRVRVKWYLGGIAGDENGSIERIRRGQLDGAAGAMFCDRLAPSLQVTRVAGLLRTREEASRAVNGLHDTIASEFAKNGFVYLGSGGFGLDVVFTRQPVRNLAALRKGVYWIRPYDDVLRTELATAGVRTVVLPHAEAERAFDEGRIDGFIAPPASVLAFQWYSRAHAFLDAKLAYLDGCVALHQSAFDRLSVEDQRAVREQAAMLAGRFELTGRDIDDKLLHGLFEKMGLTRVVPDAPFRDELAAALHAARSAIPEQMLPRALLERVAALVSH